ncbi:hypothetical protein SUGI_1088720 [Cryptomeria japonica]|nr:hypothetical protein SUGI_1088720 [Cryptomeria japonica]
MNRNEESGWSIVSCCELKEGVMLFISARGSEAHSVHSHKWKIDYLEWSPDCVKETVMAINGQYPGPAIKAQAGDTIVVEVENLLPAENVVIHWHGIRQIGTPWNDGTAYVSQCPIFAGETYNYTFCCRHGIAPGTYFYHGHYGLQRTAGLYGWLIVEAAEKEPFSYDGDLRILLNEQWHQSVYEQSYGLSSHPMHWIGEPRSLLMEGKGKFDCSKPGSGDCNPSNPQFSPTLLPVKSGSMYRLRIASMASLSSLNFIIQGHKMTVVEADGHYVEPVEVDNLDVYSGESYSVLLRANQDPSRNYWAGVNVRSRVPMTTSGVSILNYVPNPSMKLPVDRQLLLLNTQNYINGAIKWAINNISLLPPPTPYLAATKYNIKGAYDTAPPPESYDATSYNIFLPPPNTNAKAGNGAYVFNLSSVVDVILQNANTLFPNHSEVHPWHMHGHDFWILGYGEGAFDPRKDPQTFNLVNPPLRNTVPFFPYGCTVCSG